MSLILDDVTVRRELGPVISHVSLEVRPGEITVLVGPNGAGKTSLLEGISGIVGSVTGSMTMDGKDLRASSRRRRSMDGLKHVEQGRTIFPNLTVRENIALTSRTKEDLHAAFEHFPELEKRMNAPTKLLSGGEQQMVVLARAFASRPRYLLVDEMSLGLAPVIVTRLIPVVARIAESGVGVLLVEQFAHLALRVATTAVVVTSGRMSYNGSAAALLDDESGLRDYYLG